LPTSGIGFCVTEGTVLQIFRRINYGREVQAQSELYQAKNGAQYSFKS
jgi:hypothetical protein